MSWPSPLRVHLGNGRVYLGADAAGDWVNVDLAGARSYLAPARQDLVERWRTTDGDAYYARQTTSVADIAAVTVQQVDTVCDVHADVLRGLPFGAQAVHELLCRQMFEHLSRHEARRFLTEVEYAIAPGGVLRLDVPDAEGTMAALVDEPDAARRRFLLRHILGARRDDYSYHHHGYTRAGLRQLVEAYGFQYVGEEPPLAGRLYPAFCLRFRKPAVDVIDPIPWQRLLAGVEIPPTARCLEVGPGSRRYWPRANTVLDVVDRGTDDRPPGSTFVQADVCGDLPFADGEFDFVLISHVLEHVADPARAAANLSRIAKGGILECPHPFKEMLFGFEGAGHDHTAYAGHEWWVFPPAPGADAVRFERPNVEMMRGLTDREMTNAMHRILRLGPQLGPDGEVLRRWFTRGQPHLNTVHRWTGPLRVEVRA